MFRTFTLALSNAYVSIWDMMIADGFINNIGEMLVSGVKNSAIITDRVNSLDVRPADANTGTVLYRDAQADPGTEQELSNMSKRSNRNSICLRDYKFLDSTGGDKLVVEIESV